MTYFRSFSRHRAVTAICLRLVSFPKRLFVASLLLTISVAHGQNSPINFQLEAHANATSADHVPFWFRARQGGSIPLSGVSGSLIGHISKDYDTTRKRIIDWGIGLEGRANGRKSETEMILIQANAKVKLAMFEIKAGRWRQQVGLVDTTLSSGAFSISGNALGIPQVQISIPEFYTLPFTNGWFSVKGSLSQGWLGNTAISKDYWVQTAETYFHHKSFYGRLGSREGRINVYAGFNHQAFWGNEHRIFGASFDLTPWQSYQSVLYGKNWASSKIGNHAGSIDLGFNLRLKSSDLLAYRQFFYEAGGLAHFANVLDGLNGVSLTNRKYRERKKQFLWEKVILEVLYSANQGGKLSSPATPTGAENYYNHYIYQQGWSYKEKLLGNPLFTTVTDARTSQISANQYVINNRLLAFHTGGTASFNRSRIKVLATYSFNYGTFATSGEPYRIPFHQIQTPSPELKFMPVRQLSFLFAYERDLENVSTKPKRLNNYLGATLGADTHGILPASIGGFVKYGIRI